MILYGNLGDSVAENMTFREFTKQADIVYAIFDRHKIIYEYDEAGDYHPRTEAVYTRQALETKVRNLKGSGYDASEAERVLAMWPE
jgi:hypothetical protein